MKTTAILAAAALLSAGTFAYAGDAKVTGMAGGAVTGAVVGGPVGAVIGGAVGLAAGSAIEPPPDRVVTYVREQPLDESVVVKERVVIGKRLPDRVTLVRIPDNDRYAYAVVNKHRVIVNPRTRTVVKVVE